MSDAAKQNLSEAKKGKKIGPMSEDNKAKISKGSKGKKKSPESIAKRTATRAANGFTLSEDARSKISETLSGRPHTEEQKEKQSQGLRNWWSKRKEIG